MKKNLFYLFAVICTITLFASCGGDDDTTWQQIPQTEISGTDAVFVLNGMESETGSVQLSVKDGGSGVLTLKDVVPGYSNVPVDVILEKQPNNSFIFKGTAQVHTPPTLTRTAAPAEFVMNVDVNGSITLEGKIVVQIESTFTAQGEMVKTWDLSKEVNAGLEVGRTAVAITWDAINPEEKNCEYVATLGSVLGAHLISEVLRDVTFGADGNITASYFNTLITGEIGAQEWIMGKIFDNSPNVNPAPRTWLESPKNLAYWYTQGDKLYILPNIEMILKQVSQDGGADYSFIAEIIKQIATADDAALNELLEMLKNIDMVKELGIDLSTLTLAQFKEILGWLNTGIPLYHAITPEGLEIWVDKAMVTPFMPILLSALPQVDKLIEEMGATDPMIGMLPLILGFEKISDMQGVWKNNTADFKLGLRFSTKAVAE